MSAKQAVITTAVRQFRHPRGVGGRLVGWVMAHRSSNRQRNLWVARLLDVQPTDRVLEIGFGPGVAIAEMSSRAGDTGHIYGIDHSEVMLRQASRRNAQAIRAGKVTLTLGTVEELPGSVEGPFDAIVTVNTLQFWENPSEQLEDLRRRLVPGGRIAIASQPRCPGATRATTLDAAREITELLRSAGFGEAKTEVLDLDPPVACIVASS